MKKLTQAASVIVVLGGLGLFLSSSSCGSSTPAAVADNSVGGSAGAGGGAETGGASGTTGGGAGTSTPDDAAVGSGGASVDMDATIFIDGTVEIPDGTVSVGDSSLNDDGGDPPLDDAGSTLSDGGVVAKKYGVYCTGPDAPARKACTGPVTNCCYDSDTATGACSSTRCSTTAGTYTCDGPEDCDAGEACCGAISTAPILKGSPHHEYSTFCTSSCGKGFVQTNTAYVVVCKRAADCAVGQSCNGPATNMPGGLGLCQSIRAL